MNLVLETILVILQTLYLSVEAFILLLIPSHYRRKDVTEDVVLVTGAGSGIGQRMAINFAKHGAVLVLWDINKQGNEETANKIKKFGGRVFTYVCDLSNRDDIYKTADKVKEEVGNVTMLVNNAGIVTGRKFLDCPDGLIEKTMAVNTMAHFWTCKAFFPDMIKSNKGHIVTIASSAGIVGVNGLADYCASKFAAVGLDESLRFELKAQGKDGINTTVVCPYYINTGMFEGIKTRFPLILPVVDQEYAANKIVDCVLINQHMVYMPRILYLILGMKGILPWSVQYLICKFLGTTVMMDTFKGREKLQ